MSASKRNLQRMEQKVIGHGPSKEYFKKFNLKGDCGEGDDEATYTLSKGREAFRRHQEQRKAPYPLVVPKDTDNEEIVNRMAEEMVLEEEVNDEGSSDSDKVKCCVVELQGKGKGT